MEERQEEGRKTRQHAPAVNPRYTNSLMPSRGKFWRRRLEKGKGKGMKESNGKEKVHSLLPQE